MKIIIGAHKSVRDFSAKIGVSDGVLRAYLAGKSLPGMDILVKIAQMENIEADWLLYGTGPMLRDKKNAPIYNGTVRPLDSEDFAYIPVAESRLAAGNGAPVLDHEETLDIISFRRPWVSRVATSANNLVAFFVEGDSMTPTLEDGDLVLIDKGRTQPRTGAIFAVCVGGDLLQIKRLEVIGPTVRVIADNRANYPATELPPEQVTVLGQVVWFCRELVRRKL